MFELALSLFKDIPHDLSLGRMLEAFILLGIVWRKLEPHLKQIEKRMEGLENAVKEGFNSGEERFKIIETRITDLEQKGNQDGK